MPTIIDCVLRNDLKTLELLLGRGADPDLKDGDHRTALIHAAIDGNSEIARTLIHGGWGLDVQDESGNAALHYAAQGYHQGVASLLLDAGARVDVEDAFGNTPLWRAVFNSNGRGELIKLLLAAGADRRHRNKRGKTVIELVETIANYNLAQFFE